ncbi:MAG: PAS domain-containing sensor histidine kinase [Candidatus Sabulitectum sp.]|nr:PAS domain-containing sensor histidine kinase [Candidatus Sabulitectum sp.]
MKSGARRFVLGIEGLTALVTGASALAAVVAFLVLWLVVSDARTTLESASYSRAEFISHALGIRPTQSSLESIVSSSIPGGGVKAAVVVFDNSDVLAYPSISLEEFEHADRITYSSTSGYSVSLLMEMPSVLGESTAILSLFAFFAAVLTVVAILVPSFLRRTVLDPLRSILGEADRLESGSGSTARAANASFQKLVDLLGKKDLQLDEMRVDALNRAQVAESRSGTVLEAMGSAVMVIDPLGNPSLWNRQASDLFQLQEERNKKKSLADYLEPFLEKNITEWDGENNGRIFRYKVTRGEDAEKIVLVTDVTSPVMLERRLAEESALADLGALSGGVAHEIGNALCALDGFLELLGRGGDSIRTMGILDEAGLELDSARKMVESFRNLAQHNSIDSSISTNTAIFTIKGICESQSVKCKINSGKIPDPEIFIPGGEILITRIVENLLSNALRFSPSSTVELSVSDSSEEHVLILCVLDRGSGLPEPPETVFRPMYTTAETQGGMGLGLTITRRLVRAMGGSIKAENREQGGAVFTVIIPHLESEE